MEIGCPRSSFISSAGLSTGRSLGPNKVQTPRTPGHGGPAAVDGVDYRRAGGSVALCTEEPRFARGRAGRGGAGAESLDLCVLSITGSRSIGSHSPLPSLPAAHTHPRLLLWFFLPLPSPPLSIRACILTSIRAPAPFPKGERFRARRQAPRQAPRQSLNCRRPLAGPSTKSRSGEKRPRKVRYING